MQEDDGDGEVLSWAVYRYTSIGNMVCRLLVVTAQHIVTVDPTDGRITAKYATPLVTVVSWDKNTDQLFRIVFQNGFTLVMLSDDRFQIIKTLVGFSKIRSAHLDDESAAFIPTELDCECDFVVQFVDFSQKGNPRVDEVISLGAHSIQHMESTSPHNIFRKASYTQVQKLTFPEDPAYPYLVVLLYFNEPHEVAYQVSPTDFIKFITLLQARVHFHYFLTKSRIENVHVRDLDDPHVDINKPLPQLNQLPPTQQPHNPPPSPKSQRRPPSPVPSEPTRVPHPQSQRSKIKLKEEQHFEQHQQQQQTHQTHARPPSPAQPQRPPSPVPSHRARSPSPSPSARPSSPTPPSSSLRPPSPARQPPSNPQHKHGRRSSLDDSLEANMSATTENLTNLTLHDLKPSEAGKQRTKQRPVSTGKQSSTFDPNTFNSPNPVLTDNYQPKRSNSRSSVLDSESTFVVSLMKGTWLFKYKKLWKGKAHKRYFRMNPIAASISWCESEGSEKSKIAQVSAVQVNDAAAKNAPEFSFAIVTPKRTMYLAATSSQDFSLWTEGITWILANLEAK